MIALAFETSTRASSVAVGWYEPGAEGAAPAGPAQGRELRVVSELLGAGVAHARDLLPTVERLLDERGLAPRDITDVVVDLGPGSYTGLRVGVATALGLAVGPEPPRLVGVAAPEVLFADALGPEEAGTWLLDGRSKAWYLARGRKHAGELLLTVEPELLAEDDLAELLDSLAPGERLLADPASAARLRELRPDLGAEGSSEPGDPGSPRLDVRPIDAAVLLRCGLARLESHGATAPGELAPLYLRPFAAKVRKR